MTSRNLGLLALLLFVGIAIFWVWSHEAKELQRVEALRKRAFLQRDVVDQLIREQMKERNFNGSKSEFCRSMQGPPLDFLIGQDLSRWPQLSECGDVVDDRFLKGVVLKENAREWMQETGNKCEYLGFLTDPHDFRTEYMPFSYTLILATQDGKIVACRSFAEAPY